MFFLQTEGSIMINLSFAFRFKLHQKSGKEYLFTQSSCSPPEDDTCEDPLCVPVPQHSLGMNLLTGFFLYSVLNSKHLFNVHS